jgi:hypothetical protein
MNSSFINCFKGLVALLVVVGALTHGFIDDISIFHGFVIHPCLIVLGILLITVGGKLKMDNT